MAAVIWHGGWFRGNKKSGGGGGFGNAKGGREDMEGAWVSLVAQAFDEMPKRDSVSSHRCDMGEAFWRL